MKTLFPVSLLQTASTAFELSIQLIQHAEKGTADHGLGWK
jgi:hypothetical protein